MKTITYALLCLLPLYCVSCKSKKKVTGNAPTATAQQDTPAITTPTDSTYRFVVSFYSIGEGIDYKAKDEFESLLNSLGKIKYEPVHWGREGEIDYCLTLKELSSTEQSDFIKKSKELLSKSKLVHINENEKCLHKR